MLMPVIKKPYFIALVVSYAALIPSHPFSQQINTINIAVAFGWQMGSLSIGRLHHRPIENDVMYQSQSVKLDLNKKLDAIHKTVQALNIDA